jgi:Flp pilus assembly protein TadD
MDWRLGNYQQATDHLQQAVGVCRETGDRLGEAHALTDLGVDEARQGHDQRAADHHRQALTLFRETGDRLGEAVGG